VANLLDTVLSRIKSSYKKRETPNVLQQVKQATRPVAYNLGEYGKNLQYGYNQWKSRPSNQIVSRNLQTRQAGLTNLGKVARDFTGGNWAKLTEMAIPIAQQTNWGASRDPAVNARQNAFMQKVIPNLMETSRFIPSQLSGYSHYLFNPLEGHPAQTPTGKLADLAGSLYGFGKGPGRAYYKPVEAPVERAVMNAFPKTSSKVAQLIAKGTSAGAAEAISSAPISALQSAIEKRPLKDVYKEQVGMGLASRGALGLAGLGLKGLANIKSSPGTINWKAFVPERKGDIHGLIRNIQMLGEDDKKIMEQFYDFSQSNPKGKLDPTESHDIESLRELFGLDQNISNKTLGKYFQEILSLSDQMEKSGGFVRLPGESVLRAKKRIAEKGLDFLGQSESPEDAIKRIKLLESKAAQTRDIRDFHALKNSLKQYRKTLVTGPGLPQHPDNYPVIQEIDGVLLKTKLEPPKGVGEIKSGLRVRPEQPMLPGGEVPKLEPGAVVVETPAQARRLMAKGIQAEVRPKLRVGKETLVTPPGELKEPSLTDLQTRLYGSPTPTEITTGTKSGAGLLGNQLRSYETKISQGVEELRYSPSSFKRNVGRLLQGWARGLGRTETQNIKRAELRGGVDTSVDTGAQIIKEAQRVLGDQAKPSLERIHQVMDPELFRKKGISPISLEDLNAEEKNVMETLRLTNDFINSQNYKMGLISEATYLKNRGKYIARAYTPFEIPPEMSDLATQKRFGLETNLYKQRKDLTKEMADEALLDPSYLTAKRLQQTMFNAEIRKYTDWIMSSGRYSDVEQPGFTKLSDSKAYGDLAGKWVHQDTLEDMRGFYFVNKMGQQTYDLLRMYDQWGPRQAVKKLKTIYNPAVRLGNRAGNYVFAWFNGINPATFYSNRQWAKRAIKGNNELYRFAKQQGIMGTDLVKMDLAKMADGLKEGQDAGTIKKIDKWLGDSYGRVDDEAKLAALKTWIDRGVSQEEAIRRVRRGFQDYSNVGFLWDIGAKLPILGNPFIRFKSELIRMAKNAAVDHPIRAIGTVAMFKLFGDAMSAISNETPEDRKTRETRIGVGRIPFTDISTELQTPFGAVDVRRMIGVSDIIAPDRSSFDLLSPVPVVSNKEDLQKEFGNDPLAGPLMSVLFDTDFRGKSIKDPNQNKYTGSLLTPEEQRENQLKYLAFQYNLPSLNDFMGVIDALKGQPNFYGQERTPIQALARMIGFRIQEFGPQQAAQSRQRDLEFQQGRKDSLQKQQNAITKQYLQGKITAEQMETRINSINQQMNTVSLGVPSKADIPTQTYQFINESGDLQTVEVKDIVLPKLTGMPLVDRQIMYGLGQDINKQLGNTRVLLEMNQITAEEANEMYLKLAAFSEVQKALYKELGKKSGLTGATTGRKKSAKIKIPKSKPIKFGGSTKVRRLKVSRPKKIAPPKVKVYVPNKTS
jgi:hypothetical protein